MFNYRITMTASFIASLENIENLFRTIARRADEVGAECHNIEDMIDAEIKKEDGSVDVIRDLQSQLETVQTNWKEERKGYDEQIFGSKKKGIEAPFEDLTKEFYEAYCEYVCGSQAGMKKAVYDFLWKHSIEGDVKEKAVKEFTASLLCTIGGRFASNKKINEGSDFIVAMTAKNFKKYLFGALIDTIKRSTIKTR